MPTEPRIAMNRDAAARAMARSFSFVARDITAAVEEIRTKLGPDAVILNIRRLPARGVLRLWKHPKVEVIACLPDEEDVELEESAAAVEAPSAGELPAAAAEQKSASPKPLAFPSAPPAPKQPTVPNREAAKRYAKASGGGAPLDETKVAPAVDFASLLEEHSGQTKNGSPWRSAAVLERVGLNPLHVEQVLEKMQQLHGANRRLPNSLTEELELAREALLRLWRPRAVPRSQTGAPLHIFIGPPGAGKSTVLCKWLAQTVLLEGQAARVWRLDGRTANTSETVSIYGEILGVRVERNWTGRGDATQTGFIDLPGVDFQDAGALEALGLTLAQFPGAQVHLVLNAAYTTALLLAQARAFSGLPVTDLVMTHLDEETSWGKLWNLVLGTNCPLGFLSAGQNVPGRFSAAQAESLCGPLFAEK